jgi:hypothetical protein
MEKALQSSSVWFILNIEKKLMNIWREERLMFLSCYHLHRKNGRGKALLFTVRPSGSNVRRWA